MITIFPLIGEAFLQSSRELFSVASLPLSQTLGGPFEFAGMVYLLACGECEQVHESRVNPDVTVHDVWDRVWGSIDHETEIPARGTFDESPTLNLALWNVLFVVSHLAQSRDADAVPIRGSEWVRERDADELIPLSFELGALGQLLEASLPGRIHREQDALQGMAGNPKRLAMVSEKVLKVFGGIVNAIFRVEFDLANRPVIHARQVPQPDIELGELFGFESNLELTLNHTKTVSALRCIA